MLSIFVKDNIQESCLELHTEGSLDTQLGSAQELSVTTSLVVLRTLSSLPFRNSFQFFLCLFFLTELDSKTG